MNTKTVKEKVEDIIKKQTLAIICKECNGGGYNYDKKENCEECDGTGLSEWRFGTAIEEIDKLYRKEMLKELPKEKKILWPLNGCRKDCKICKIEVENWNSCLREAKKVLFYNK